MDKKSKIKLILWVIFTIALVASGLFVLQKEIIPESPQYVLLFSDKPSSATSDTREHISLDEQKDIYKIAVIVNNVGLNENFYNLIRQSLNGDVSLAFSPYTQSLKEKIEQNSEGYIRLVERSSDFSKEDTGPKSLSFNKESENDDRILSEVFDMSKQIRGIVLDGRVAPEKADGIKNVLELINDKGAILIDATDNGTVSGIYVDGLRRIRADVVVDENASKYNLQALLKDTKEIAKVRGRAVAVVNLRPINVLLLNEWIKQLSEMDESVRFVHVSELVK